MRVAALLVGLLAIGGGTARADDRFELAGMFDVRAVSADATPSFLNGGLGRTRFDSDHEGLRLGRAFALGRVRLTDTLSASAVIEAYGDGDKTPVGVTEAWVDWRPFPANAVRWRVRAGAFYLPVSLEHRAAGWTSPYTLSASAINTWVGEEFRVLGTEIEARWLGASSGYRGDVALVGGVYGWNDPAGAIIAARGWALTDRPTLLFSGLGRPRTELFHELDGRPGYYAGVSWRHSDLFELRALRYDNRADPAASDLAQQNFGWETRFWNVGVRIEPGTHWTVIAQHLDGKTFVGADADGPNQYALRLSSWFGLLSGSWGRHRVTARYDHFSNRQDSGFGPGPNSDDTGHAVTIAWFEQLDPHWELGAEWIRVRSRFGPRRDYGLADAATDRQLQLALRYRFHLEGG